MEDIQKSPPVTDTESDFADREIDFTKQFTTKRRENRASISFLTQSTVDEDSKCGFCTDESNCLCRAESLRSIQEPARPSQMSEPTRDWMDSRPLKNGPVSGPGTCADCIANPRQRAWCQRVAQLRGEASRPSSRRSSINSNSSRPMSPLSSRNDSVVDIESDKVTHNTTIGCRDAFKILDGRVSMESERMNWIRTLKPVSMNGPADDDMGRRYSALELDTASIIATLQQSMTSSLPTPPS